MFFFTDPISFVPEKHRDLTRLNKGLPDPTSKRRSVQVPAPCKPSVLTVRTEAKQARVQKNLLKLKEKMKARKLQAKQRTDPEADGNDVCDAVPRHPLPAVHMTYMIPSAPFPVNSYYIRDGPRHPLPDNPMTYGTSNVHSYNVRSKLCRPQWVRHSNNNFKAFFYYR
jgi:hypothetical protein